MTQTQNVGEVTESILFHSMDKVIPILPCPDIKGQVVFYQQLGFELLEVYTSPNPYAAIQSGSIELHFYGNKRMIPTQNPTMCFLKVEDVDAVYHAFTSGLKKHTGKILRSGIPRISKVRDLSNDRRFTLTDTGGNTLFIGTPVKADTSHFFRTLQQEEFAKKFTVLYDLLYSKEDPSMAASMLPKLVVAKDLLADLDRAKLLLVALDIQRQLGQLMDDRELKTLVDIHLESGDEWTKVKKRYFAILEEE
ncbi:hypothetical protein Q0590_08720 [Rhodocytophaga aerolata]|uniref:VOC family protein n=1 Tax=Rhodocytophaga aerolata TaxID=455078 RepID=A0ABT8R2K5_9BACT|nr:hypothetical protein [Rhodocytophaga aerolata]MDO1446331.1 hypothetical protein [Rhodocytophaga aerolata]